MEDGRWRITCRWLSICDSMTWWGNVAVGTSVEASTSNVNPSKSPYVDAISTVGAPKILIIEKDRKGKKK